MKKVFFLCVGETEKSENCIIIVRWGVFRHFAPHTYVYDDCDDHEWVYTVDNTEEMSRGCKKENIKG